MAKRHKSDLDEVKSAVTALAACIVQTLAESDPSFQGRFEARLAEWYATLREEGSYDIHALELLTWIRHAVRSDYPLQLPNTP
jgi:hypothetical protein